MNTPEDEESCIWVPISRVAEATEEIRKEMLHWRSRAWKAERKLRNSNDILLYG